MLSQVNSIIQALFLDDEIAVVCLCKLATGLFIELVNGAVKYYRNGKCK